MTIINDFRGENIGCRPKVVLFVLMPPLCSNWYYRTISVYMFNSAAITWVITVIIMPKWPSANPNFIFIVSARWPHECLYLYCFSQLQTFMCSPLRHDEPSRLGKGKPIRFIKTYIQNQNKISKNMMLLSKIYIYKIITKFTSLLIYRKFK
jgi:oligoribonuclease (3'-5' exoribonuclease)